MQLFVLTLASLLLTTFSAYAAPQWELCLDRADFSFNVDGLSGSVTARKSGCQAQFASFGGKGEKFELDLCDANIHLKYYAAIDATSFRRIAAGSAGCPAPLFGADFDENTGDFTSYKEMRKRVLDLFEKVKQVYGEGAEKVDLSKPASFSPEVSAGKIACGQYLLNEYLTKCMAFENKKVEFSREAPAANSNIPGVHPQTILVPKK